MLNLQELEKELDDVLANETEESLTNWLLNKRLSSYLGEDGNIESPSFTESITFSCLFPVNELSTSKNLIESCNYYLNAA